MAVISKSSAVTWAALASLSGVTKASIDQKDGVLGGYIAALLHFNGADASTTFTDETGKVWTASGNAQIDTAQSVFGGASGLFDGTGDYISTADHTDWRLDGGSNSNLWTIDFLVRFSSVAANRGFIQQRVDNNNFWSITWFTSSGMNFLIRSASVNIVNLDFAWSPSINTWYHVAVVKNGVSGYMMFVDGTQIGTTQTDTDPMPDFAGGVTVGRMTNFTPPAAEY
jgi:hypothetical protein